MATFIPKRYTCTSCGHQGKVIAAYKTVEDAISSTVPDNWPENPLLKDAIYVQILIRESDDLLPVKKVLRAKCDRCHSIEIEYNPLDDPKNVLNFYPKTEAEKYLTGFDKFM